MGKLLKNSFAMSIMFSTYLIMITVNILANVMPINGLTTGDVSSSYPNLFTPKGYVFSIWGLIYIALAALVIYFCKSLFQEREFMKEAHIQVFSRLFALTCVLNSAWIIAWHNRIILITLVIMVALLVVLLMLRTMLSKEELDLKGRILLLAPVSLYLGWIIIATIANITVYLVSTGWDGMGLSGPVWTVIVLIAGLVIGGATILRFSDPIVGAVCIWAYIGILLRYLGPFTGGKYSSILITASVAILVFIILEIVLLLKGNILYGRQQTNRE